MNWTAAHPFQERSSAAGETEHVRFARRVTSALNQRSEQLPADIGERLRFARQKALEQASAARRSSEAANSQPGFGHAFSARLLQLGKTQWVKVASVLPIVALVGGLILIDQWQDASQAAVATEVDAALLADDLPPKAYTDAGFVEYLKAPEDDVTQ